MLNIMEYEAKSKEEAIERCLNELNCLEEDLIIRTETIDAKLFKSGKSIIYVCKKKDIIEFIKTYMSQFSKFSHISINCEVLEKEEGFQVTLISDQTSILIGKEGRTLNALQILIRQSIQNQTGCNVRVHIDASNYKKKKMNHLEREIKIIAQEVLESKIDVSLDPMNSYERRLVHSIIGNYTSLTTQSIGEGNERHIIIKYVGE